MVRAWFAMLRPIAWRIPPGGARGELESPPVFEFLHRAHQADVPFLDKIEERLAAVLVLTSDRDDEAQVALHHFRAGFERLALPLFQFLEFREKFLPVQPHSQLRMVPAPMVRRGRRGRGSHCPAGLFDELDALLGDTELEIEPRIERGEFLVGFRKCLGEWCGFRPATVRQIVDVMLIAETDRFFQSDAEAIQNREIAFAPFEPAGGHGLIETFFPGKEPSDQLEMSVSRAAEPIKVPADLLLGSLHPPANVGLLFTAEQAMRGLPQIEPQVIFRGIARSHARFILFRSFCWLASFNFRILGDAAFRGAVEWMRRPFSGSGHLEKGEGFAFGADTGRSRSQAHARGVKIR